MPHSEMAHSEMPRPQMANPLIAHFNTDGWQEHPRFPGITMKTLLTRVDNALASINGVRVPSNGVIGRHQHPEQVETVFVVTGNCFLMLNDEDVALAPGSIIAIPADLPHALRNAGAQMVELLTIFTPPLG